MLGGRSFGKNLPRVGKAAESLTALSLGIQFNCACCAVELAPILIDRCGAGGDSALETVRQPSRFGSNRTGFSLRQSTGCFPKQVEVF